MPTLTFSSLAVLHSSGGTILGIRNSPLRTRDTSRGPCSRLTHITRTELSCSPHPILETCQISISITLPRLRVRLRNLSGISAPLPKALLSHDALWTMSCRLPLGPLKKHYLAVTW